MYRSKIRQRVAIRPVNKVGKPVGRYTYLSYGLVGDRKDRRGQRTSHDKY